MWVVAAIFFALSGFAHAQAAKRLILKDGSYQVATKWEVHGDRVKYWSSERGDWEEVPNSLVDWTATERWNAERKQVKDPELAEETAEERAERVKEEANTPVVAPGIRLQSQGGVFLMDQYKGQPQLAELVQSGGSVNKNMGKNILRAAINPLPMGSKQSVELKGLKARVQSHTTMPVIYIDIDQDTQSAPINATDRFRIVRMQVKKDARVVGNLKIAIWGKVSEQHNYIPAKGEKFSGDWVRVTPTQPLEPGEYAVVELLGEGKVNMFVWDFGVDANAPQNAGAWKPEPVKDNSMGTWESPVLVPGKR